MNPMAEVTYKTVVHKLEHLGGHYLEVSPEVMVPLQAKIGSRLVCTINQLLTFPCGLISLGKGVAYIILSARRMKDAHIKLGQEVTVSLTLDESKYGMQMPEELEVLLEQDDAGRERFEKLTPGKQRTIIHYVGLAKSAQTRVERAIRYVENLKRQPLGKESVSKILG